MNPSTYPIGTRYRVPGDHWAAGYHTGVDYLAPLGSPVLAPRASRIIHAGTAGGWGAAYGRHVIGETTVNGTVFRWIAAHLSATLVTPGDQVLTAAAVGRSGDTGNTTGPHLHFEVRAAPYAYGDDVHPSIVTAAPPTLPPTPQLDRQIDELGAAIASSKPGRVRRLRRTARRALIQARAIIRGRA